MRLLDWQYAPPHRPDADEEAIRHAVSDWIRSVNRATVALPVGAGVRPGRAQRLWNRLRRRPEELLPHPDHQFVRDAVLSELADRSDVSILLYEELPYVWTAPADSEARRLAAGLGRTAIPLVLDVDRRAKAARIGAYVSQLPHLWPDARLDDPSVLPATERYWRLDRRKQ